MKINENLLKKLEDGENIVTAIIDKKLVIVVDKDAELVLSSTGKTHGVAKTRSKYGVKVPGMPDNFRLSLQAFKYPEKANG